MIMKQNGVQDMFRFIRDQEIGISVKESKVEKARKIFTVTVEIFFTVKEFMYLVHDTNIFCKFRSVRLKYSSIKISSETTGPILSQLLTE